MMTTRRSRLIRGRMMHRSAALAAAVVVLLIPAALPAERKLLSAQGFEVVLEGDGGCSSAVRFTVRAPSRSTFEEGRAKLQKVIVGARWSVSTVASFMSYLARSLGATHSEASNSSLRRISVCVV